MTNLIRNKNNEANDTIRKALIEANDTIRHGTNESDVFELKDRYGDVIYSQDLSNEAYRNRNFKFLINSAMHEDICLTDADLSNLDLSGVYFRGCNLSNAVIHNTDLFGANLSSVRLYGADLKNVNLGLANLCNAKLNGADLTDVNLFASDLMNADLSHARLNKANLYFAKLTSVKTYKTVFNDIKINKEDAHYIFPDNGN